MGARHGAADTLAPGWSQQTMTVDLSSLGIALLAVAGPLLNRLGYGRLDAAAAPL